jgi:ferritin-like metal-binding protein YciE
MDNKQVEELVLQSLEQEIKGERIYDTALECAVNTDLRDEWSKYLDETKMHVAVLKQICEALSIDPEKETTGRAVVRHVGTALEEAMKLAQSSGDATAAELVASECVVLAETKDHLDWELLGRCAEHLNGKAGKAINSAYMRIEDQEDEHLYHTKGFCRELWIKSLGMNAVLPPPEEREKVKTAVAAAEAEKEADEERE